MMEGLTAAAIVRAWEIAEARGPLDRALGILWAAGDRDDLAGLPLAERDRRLLALHQNTFGGGLTCVTECPDCGERLELELAASELARTLVAPAPETIARQGTEVELRALDSRDLAAAAALPEEEIAAFLRQRVCGTTAFLPPALTPEIDARIEEREGSGEIRLALSCTDCGTGWTEILDVVTHLWAEIETAAHRIMGEVAEIAGAFGWSEAEILGMASPRRRSYLQIARGG